MIELFRRIHEHHDKPRARSPIAWRAFTAAKKLLLTNDVQRTNKISYYRCAQGHGRLTTFVQFLREKNFVRTLSREIEQLKATVKTGALLELRRGGGPRADAACSHCGSPIAILDADAVEKRETLSSATSQGGAGAARQPPAVGVRRRVAAQGEGQGPAAVVEPGTRRRYPRSIR